MRQSFSLRDGQILEAMTGALPGVIERIGRRDFGDALAGMVGSLTGSDHCYLFEFATQNPIIFSAVSRDRSKLAHSLVASYMEEEYWPQDETMAAAYNGVVASGKDLTRLDVDSMPRGDYLCQLLGKPGIRERIVLSSTLGDTWMGVTMLRSGERGLADDALLHRIAALSDVIFPLVKQHSMATMLRLRLERSLTSLDEIEGVLRRSKSGLTPREQQVCARSLLAVSTAGIAAELGIGYETIVTHRRRAYHRLGISSHHELLLWFMRQAAFDMESYDQIDRRLLITENSLPH